MHHTSPADSAKTPHSIDLALETLRAGGMVILSDSQTRENEGDFVMAAEYVTPEAVNFMLKYARGLLCVPLLGDTLSDLGIPMMVDHNHNTALHQCSFAVSVDAVDAEGSGSSAHDRARVIELLASDTATQADFAMPGHVFPLRGHPDGLKRRQGHTEGTLALMELAGLKPVGLLCEILNDDGSMARQADLAALAEQHSMPLVTMEALLTAVGN